MKHNAPHELVYEVIHRLPMRAYRIWQVAPMSRPQMAAVMAREYGRAFLIGDPFCQIIAEVSASGTVRERPFPYRTFLPHMAANRPLPSECGCRHFWYAEVAGPWSSFNPNAHHPACEHEPDAATVAGIVMRDNPATVSPDRILQVQKMVRG